MQWRRQQYSHTPCRSILLCRGRERPCPSSMRTGWALRHFGERLCEVAGQQVSAGHGEMQLLTKEESVVYAESEQVQDIPISLPCLMYTRNHAYQASVPCRKARIESTYKLHSLLELVQWLCCDKVEERVNL